MFDWVLDIFQKIGEIFQQVIAAMYQFYNEIENLSENLGNLTLQDDGLTKYIGAFRYVVGDMIYLTYYFIALFGCLYTLFILTKRVIDMFGNIKTNVFKYLKP